MSNLLHNDRLPPERVRVPPDHTPQPAPAESVPDAATLVQVLWHRRWTVLAAVVVCVAASRAYLLVAPSVYRSSGQLSVAPAGLEAVAGSGAAIEMEAYANAQAAVIKSAPVLGRALEAVNYRTMETFAGAGGDPVAWLQRGGRIGSGVARKSGVITVSMDSRHPAEAAAVVNAVMDAYLVERSGHLEASGGHIARALEKERDGLVKRLDDCRRAMLKFKDDKGVLSFREDKGNTVLERTVALATQLTTAETAAWELRAQRDAAKAAVGDGLSLAAFVQGQQFKQQDRQDREYGAMRVELMRQRLELADRATAQGRENAQVRRLQAQVESLEKQIGERERALAQAYLTDLSVQLAATEENARQLRAGLDEQRERALEHNRFAADYVKLEAEAARLQALADRLEEQIARAHVAGGAGEAGAQVLETARPGDTPVWPRKTLVSLAAAIVGSLLGLGLALLGEARGGRLRSPEHVTTVLGMPVLAAVPRLNGRLSPAARGQLVHLDTRSPAAEAFRSVRTGLDLGAPRGARTFLVTSAASGDGKSTTASNLAIAFAQAGRRTLLVDADLRGPVQHLVFEVDGAPGLSGVMSDAAKVGDAVCPTRVPNLYLLPCGGLPANPSELLASGRFELLLRTLGGAFDRVVIDSPPLLNVTDARILAALADATVFVVRMNRSVQKLGSLAMNALASVGANVVGAVAVDVRGGVEAQCYGYYGGGAWQYAASSHALLGPPGTPAANDNHARINCDASNVAADVNGGANGKRAARDDDHGGAPADRVGRPQTVPVERRPVTETTFGSDLIPPAPVRVDARGIDPADLDTLPTDLVGPGVDRLGEPPDGKRL